MKTPALKAAVELALRHGLLVILAALVIVFSLKAPAFHSPSNLLAIAENSAVLLIVALAMTLIIASGGIDLSIGVAIDFGAAFALVALEDYGAPWYVAVFAAVLGAALVGAFNALLIVGLGIRPFLSTLSTFLIGSSIQRIYTDGGGPIAFRRMDPAFRNLSTGDIAGVPMEIVIAGPVLVAYYLLLSGPISDTASTLSACSRAPPRSRGSGSAASWRSSLSSPPRPRPSAGSCWRRRSGSSRRLPGSPICSMPSARPSSAPPSIASSGRMSRGPSSASCSSASSPTASICSG
nr:ABC transporter permease [Kaistia soli]